MKITGLVAALLCLLTVGCSTYNVHYGNTPPDDQRQNAIPRPPSIGQGVD